MTRYALRMTRYALLLCWLTVPLVASAAVSGYTQARLASDPVTPALELVREQKQDTAPLVFASTKLYRRLYAATQPLGEVLLLPGDKHVPENVRVRWLNELTARGPFWLLGDEGDPDTREENLQTEQWVIDRACPIVSASVGAGRALYLAAPPGGETQKIEATFNDELTLTGYRLSSATLKPGDALCVELVWNAPQTLASDYTVYIHVVDPTGQVVAQNDMPPRAGFAPTSQWKVGVPLIDRHGMILPASLPGGDYGIRVGLYRSDNQLPVPPNALDLTKITVTP